MPWTVSLRAKQWGVCPSDEGLSESGNEYFHLPQQELHSLLWPEGASAGKQEARPHRRTGSRDPGGGHRDTGREGMVRGCSPEEPEVA